MTSTDFTGSDFTGAAADAYSAPVLDVTAAALAAQLHDQSSAFRRFTSRPRRAAVSCIPGFLQ